MTTAPKTLDEAKDMIGADNFDRLTSEYGSVTTPLGIQVILSLSDPNPEVFADTLATAFREVYLLGGRHAIEAVAIKVGRDKAESNG